MDELVSRLTFSHTTPLVSVGANGKLKHDDLPEVSSLVVAHMLDQFCARRETYVTHADGRLTPLWRLLHTGVAHKFWTACTSRIQHLL